MKKIIREKKKQQKTQQDMKKIIREMKKSKKKQDMKNIINETKTRNQTTIGKAENHKRNEEQTKINRK